MNYTNDYHYLHSDINSIIDTDLISLFDEIYNLRNEPKTGMVLHFLRDSVYSFPSKKRKPFNKAEFSTEYYLQLKVKQLIDSEIFKLCIDLVSSSKLGHIENYHYTKLYVFFNRAIRDNPKQKKL